MALQTISAQTNLVNACKNLQKNENNTGHEYPVGNYMFKVNNKNTRARCEICSKLTKETPERHHLF